MTLERIPANTVRVGDAAVGLAGWRRVSRVRHKRGNRTEIKVYHWRFTKQDDELVLVDVGKFTSSTTE